MYISVSYNSDLQTGGGNGHKIKTTHPKQQGWKRSEELNVQGG